MALDLLLLADVLLLAVKQRRHAPLNPHVPPNLLLQTGDKYVAPRPVMGLLYPRGHVLTRTNH
jgi:hypothetical protein